MLGINITSVGFIASLLLGASGLVVNPGRAAGINVGDRSDSQPVALLSGQTMAERRSTRQKRCVRHLTESNPVAPTPVAGNSSDIAPANVAPAPTPSQVSTTSSEQVPQPQPSPNVMPATSGGGGGTDTFTGQLTFYDVGLGACGGTNSDSDMIAAASMLLYDGFDGYTGGNSNNNPICGKQVQITFEGKSIVVTIVDRCVGCAREDLDLSPTAFALLANRDRGRVSGATWHFL